MHNEDLEGDIERCWTALKATCAEQGTSTVPLVDVMAKLRPLLVQTFGLEAEDAASESFVASFIAGLFLTHRRMASVTQEGEAVANIMIEDLWPKHDDFHEVLEAVEAMMANDAEDLQGEATGSDHRLEAIAERARRAEEREAKRLAKLNDEADEVLAQGEAAVVQADEETDLSEHDWLVE